MKEELAALEQKDPEFFKYLKQNDSDLLNFDPDAEPEEQAPDTDDESMDENAAGQPAERTKKDVVSMVQLRKWQAGIIQSRSLRSLRQLLLAFRAASRAGDEGADDINMPSALERDGSAKRQAIARRRQRAALEQERNRYMIDNPRVFEKVVQTTMAYTPLVLTHHVPFKAFPLPGSSESDGLFRFRVTQNGKAERLQQPLKSLVNNLSALVRALPNGRADEEEDEDTDSAALLRLVIEQSMRLVPYIIAHPNKVVAKTYVRTLISVWSTAADRVRVSAFLSMRAMMAAGDGEIRDLLLKYVYHTLLKVSKRTNLHNLPQINLMKNSAAELFRIDPSASYQQAFGFIRQLAILLRNALQTKSKESLQNVYNWQFIHAIDFWASVLALTCDQSVYANGDITASNMEPLIYPLVQVALGSIRLIPISRYFPLRFHVSRALLRIIQRTGVYIPLAPYLLETLDAPEFTRKTKGTSLPALDLDAQLRVPTNFVRTSVYADRIAEEVSFLLMQFLATQARSLAFPELTTPIVIQLRRKLRTASAGKTKGKGTAPKTKGEATIKTMVDKVDSQRTWVETRRNKLDFAPAQLLRNNMSKMDFLQDPSEGPLEAAARLAKKVRDQKRELLAQAQVKV